jgi:hypothetical protein
VQIKGFWLSFMNSVDGADIYQRAVDKCKELIDDCNSLPELDGKGRLVGKLEMLFEVCYL